MRDSKTRAKMGWLVKLTASAAFVAAGIIAGCGGDSNDTGTDTIVDASADVSVARDGSSTPLDSSLSCADGETACSGVCVDTTTSSANCGTCGTACASGQVCSKGACALSCNGGTTICAGVCRDTSSDPGNCGACGAACAAGQVCSAGVCALTCGGGTTQCGASCVDTKVDSSNCGGCGKTCATGLVCSAGACSTFCGSGLTECGLSTPGGDGGSSSGDAGDGGDAGSATGAGDGGASAPFCVDANNDRRNCGACGNVCPVGDVCALGTCTLTCPVGEINCNGTCIDPLRDKLYCGATLGCGLGDAGSAGTPCATGNACTNGTCQVSCPANQINCGGACIDPTSNRTNCGATTGCGVGGVGSAGTSCATGNVCGNGTCQVSCPASQINCGGTCIDPNTSRTNCGATAGCGLGDVGRAGTACATGSVCGNGTCQVACPGAQIDCGGTCVDPTTSRTNCGATAGCGVNGTGTQGTACATGNVCSAGTCQVSCPATQVLCGGQCIVPATSNSNCGATLGCGLGDAGTAGTTCAAGTVCSGGTCGATCASPLIECSGACVDPRFDPANCNGCGLSCGPGNACVSSVCKTFIRPNLMLCGASTRKPTEFIPTGYSFGLMNGCVPDATVQALFVTRGGFTLLNALGIAAYVDAGGIVLTEFSSSAAVWTDVFGATVQGVRSGSCTDVAPTVTQFTAGDPFWQANTFQAIPLVSSGCGYDVSGFAGITPLAGWDATHVAIGYRNAGAGRVYATDFDWSDGEVSQPYAYTDSLMGYMLLHTR